jgi:hypothetical protein
MALKCRDAADWQGVGTANMEFHTGEAQAEGRSQPLCNSGCFL